MSFKIGKTEVGVQSMPPAAPLTDQPALKSEKRARHFRQVIDKEVACYEKKEKRIALVLKTISKIISVALFLFFIFSSIAFMILPNNTWVQWTGIGVFLGGGLIQVILNVKAAGFEKMGEDLYRKKNQAQASFQNRSKSPFSQADLPSIDWRLRSDRMATHTPTQHQNAPFLVDHLVNQYHLDAPRTIETAISRHHSGYQLPTRGQLASLAPKEASFPWHQLSRDLQTCLSDLNAQNCARRKQQIATKLSLFITSLEQENGLLKKPFSPFSEMRPQHFPLFSPFLNQWKETLKNLNEQAFSAEKLRTALNTLNQELSHFDALYHGGSETAQIQIDLHFERKESSFQRLIDELSNPELPPKKADELITDCFISRYDEIEQLTGIKCYQQSAVVKLKNNINKTSLNEFIQFLKDLNSVFVERKKYEQLRAHALKHHLQLKLIEKKLIQSKENAELNPDLIAFSEKLKEWESAVQPSEKGLTNSYFFQLSKSPLFKLPSDFDEKNFPLVEALFMGYVAHQTKLLLKEGRNLLIHKYNAKESHPLRRLEKLRERLENAPSLEGYDSVKSDFDNLKKELPNTEAAPEAKQLKKWEKTYETLWKKASGLDFRSRVARTWQSFTSVFRSHSSAWLTDKDIPENFPHRATLLAIHGNLRSLDKNIVRLERFKVVAEKVATLALLIIQASLASNPWVGFGVSMGMMSLLILRMGMDYKINQLKERKQERLTQEHLYAPDLSRLHEPLLKTNRRLQLSTVKQDHAVNNTPLLSRIHHHHSKAGDLNLTLLEGSLTSKKTSSTFLDRKHKPRIPHLMGPYPKMKTYTPEENSKAFGPLFEQWLSEKEPSIKKDEKKEEITISSPKTDEKEIKLHQQAIETLKEWTNILIAVDKHHPMIGTLQNVTQNKLNPFEKKKALIRIFRWSRSQMWILSPERKPVKRLVNLLFSK